MDYAVQKVSIKGSAMLYAINTYAELEFSRKISFKSNPGETKRQAMVRAKQLYALPEEAGNDFDVVSIRYKVDADYFSKEDGVWKGEVEATVKLHGQYTVDAEPGYAREVAESEVYELGNELGVSLYPAIRNFSKKNSDDWVFDRFDSGIQFTFGGVKRVLEEHAVDAPAVRF